MLVFCTPVFGFANPLQSFLKQPGVAKDKTAVYAVWTDTGLPLMAYNENLPLIPASTLKIVTAYCALKKLGPAYQIETKFYSEGPIQAGAIQNLLIQGEGDPSLVEERLWALLGDLKQKGLRHIRGNIYLDAGYFAAHDYPGRKGNNHRAYNALTSSLTVNFNAITGYRNGKKFYRSVDNPVTHFAEILSIQLKARDISLRGKIVGGNIEANHLLESYPSKPMSLIVRDMNKFSNNFIAEQLVKHLGAKIEGPPGTTAKGIRVLNRCLKEAGADTAKVEIENGSGFSRENHISAKALITVLLTASGDFNIAPEFIASLSLTGLDGTMRERNSPKELKGMLRAKTGSLDGISSLAGFVGAKKGRVVAFVILMNNYKKGYWEAQKIQDLLLTQMRKQSWNETPSQSP